MKSSEGIFVPKSKKNKKTAKKRKPDEKFHSSLVSSDYESSSEEEKVEKIFRDKIYMARVLPKFAPHIGCHTINDIEDRIKAMLTKNQFKKFCTDSIFGVFMKKKNCVVQAQLGRCIMSLETTESSTSDIVIRAKETTLHFSLREFTVVTGLNCHSNRDDFGFDEDVPNKIIDQYFDGKNENDEDAFKFANLYFIYGFLLSSVDTVIIPRIHFDLVESDRYRDYPWGLVAYEELAKSLNKKLKPTEMFYMLHGMPLAIQIWLYECCSVVPRTVASKVDSQIPRLLNWKTNSIRPRYESLMKSLFNDSNDKVVFKNIEPTRKEISTFQIPKKGNSSNSPAKKKLKNQSKDVDQHTPKRTPPSRVVKMSFVKTPIFKAIQSKETVPSNRKDILIQSPDMSFFNREDEDDVLSKKVFEKFHDEARKEFNDIQNLVTTRCDQIMNSINEMKKQEKDKDCDKAQMEEGDKNTSPYQSTPTTVEGFNKNPEGILVKDYEFVKPQLDVADKDTSPHESTPILHHDFDKNLEGTLDKIDTSVHEARDFCDSTNKKIIDESVGEAQFSSQNTFPDKVLRSINLDFIQQNLRVRDDSKICVYYKQNTEAAAEIIENTSMADCEKPNLDEQINSEVHTHEAVFGEGKSQPNLRDSQQIDVCLYYLRKKSKYEPNSSYMYSTVDCNFMNIVRAVYSIDDSTLNAGGKKYHLNEYISEFHMHGAVPWHTVDHIFIPININSKHHWVLAVLSFNSRCIYVYDSLSSADHDSAVLAEVEKLAEVIPYCLLACKFYEKKGIDIDNHPNYKLNDKHDLFDVYIVEDLP
ncbi:uncharacterized protein LOC107858285 [Capsicum annuum]|uniref:uncharacterized protein LOC107858285 n=1 Tax=Capsicum annuum TaxID=4072 RepID=UPI001FB14787|nr:uncharacterized protein LOC107858285 [Capsicum annuum]